MPAVIFAVMLVMFIGTVVWAVYFDTLQPNPGLTAHAESRSFDIADATAPGGKRLMTLPAVAALPFDQHLGNLEGKELRFGTSAGATFAAVTVDVTCGAVNAEADSLNPIAALSPMVGMWLNCIFGGKGVGMINLLLFLVIGVFVAGQMVGRTPEYLGKKIGAREMKLAMIALLVHPIMVLGPPVSSPPRAGGMQAVSNPGAHGFSQMVYQFSSASANNGSAFDGLGVAYGFYDNAKPAPMARPVGHRHGSGDALQSLPADRRPDRHGGQSWREEKQPLWAGDAARRHVHLWHPVVRDDCHHWGVALPARRRPSDRWRSTGAHSLWGVTRGVLTC